MLSFPRYFHPSVSVAIAGQSFGDVVSGTNTEAIGGYAPRIAFRITRSMQPVPDTANIDIYGLAPERREAMTTVFQTAGRSGAQILAGYEGIQSVVFTGFVRSMRSGLGLADGDIVTRVIADDAGDVIRDAEIDLPPFALRAVNVSTMIQIALEAMNRKAIESLPLFLAISSPTIVEHPSVQQVIASKSAIALIDFREDTAGSAASLLDKAARMLGCRWYIRDGQLFFAQLGLVNDPGIAVALPPEVWLAEPDDDGSGIIRVPVLFDPNLQPGRAVAIVGRLLPGVPEPCRVEHVVHTGDNDSGTPWASMLTARRLIG